MSTQSSGEAMEMRREIEDLELGERKEHSNSSAAARQSMPKLSSPSYRAAIGYKLVASPVRGPNAPSRKGEVHTRRKNRTKLFRVFKYATALDWSLMAVGTLAAILHGAIFPGAMILFGDITNALVDYTTTRTLVTNPSFPIPILTGGNGSATSTTIVNFLLLTNGSIDCSASYDTPPDLVYLLNSTFTLDDFLRLFLSNQLSCLGEAEFIRLVNTLVYIFVGLALASFLFGSVQLTTFQLACESQVLRMRLKYYRALLRQNIAWFDSNQTGEITNKLSDGINQIHDGIGDKLAIMLQWIATFFAGFVVGFVREWRLAALMAGLTPIIIATGFVVSKVVAYFASNEQKQYAAAGSLAEEVLSSIRTVLAFGGEEKELERYKKRLDKATSSGIKKGLFVGSSFFLVYFLNFCNYGAVFGFGAYLISKEVIISGDFLTVFFAVLVGSFYLGQSAPNLQSFVKASSAANDLLQIIEREPPIDINSKDGLTSESFHATIQFRNVFFSYPTRPDIQMLNGLSFTVEPGHMMALVGSSGSGKTTIMNLLLRLYDIDGGELLIGGKSISDMDLKWLRRHIGVVSQEPVLFNTTIAENIRYGKEGASMEEITAAAKKANAHDFISILPDGYDTHVGERGVQMSGGQKQRIAIARALVRDPKILLLDEATSALDTESERVVQEALDRAREGRTSIVIAHRLSTIQTADVIVSIEDGCVVEMGTHAELMETKGLYYHLASTMMQDVLYRADGNFHRKMRPRSSSTRRGRDAGSFRGSRRGTSTRHGTRHGRNASRLVNRASMVFQSIIVQQDMDMEGASSSPSDRQHCQQYPDPEANSSDVTPYYSPENRMEGGDNEEKEEEEEEMVVPLGRILRLNSKEWWLLVLGVLGSIVSGCVFPLYAILFGELLMVFLMPVESVLSPSLLLLPYFLALGFGSGVGVFLKYFCFSISGEHLTARIRSLTFNAMLKQEIGWFDDERNSSGVLTTRLAGEAAQIQGASGFYIGSLFEGGFGILLAMAIALAYSWSLALVIIGMLPLVILVGVLHQKATAGFNRGNEHFIEASEFVADSVDGIRTVASLGAEDAFYRQFKAAITKHYRAGLTGVFLSGPTYGCTQSILLAIYIVSFRFGAFLLTLPTDNVAYVEFQDIYRSFAAIVFGALAISFAASFAPDYGNARSAANKVFAIIDRQSTIDGSSDTGLKPDNVCGKINISGVDFVYPTRPDVKVLKGLNLSVEAGKTLALVGPSGCGKSTVVSLIERFYDPEAGSVTLDGNSSRVLNLHWLRSQIGIVSQEPVLFNTSIADNIRYGANFREVSDKEVIDAAKAANIHSFVESLPQGYNTNAGSKGAQLSGGQKQRIAIARALVRDPKILLLDEATSALDTESERVVQEALDRAREGRTSIVIAHRLSTIYKSSDCIAVLRKGSVAEFGTHAELMAQCGIYHRLTQFQWLLPADKQKTTDMTVM